MALSQSLGEVFGMSEVAGRILELCDGTRNFEGIVDQLTEEFEAPRDRVEADARRFLEELLQLGFLRPD